MKKVILPFALLAIVWVCIAAVNTGPNSGGGSGGNSTNAILIQNGYGNGTTLTNGTNIGAFQSDTLVIGLNSSGPSQIQVTDAVTGKQLILQGSGMSSNIVWLWPTNGSSGITSGALAFTNAGVCAACGPSGTPIWTNQLFHVGIGSGLTLDIPNRSLSSSAIGGSVFRFPDGTTVAITNREYQTHYVADMLVGNQSSTVIGSRNWRATTGPGGITSASQNSAGFPGYIKLRLWPTNISAFALVSAAANATSGFIHGSNSQEVLRWNWMLPQLPTVNTTNSCGINMGLFGVTFNTTNDPGTAAIYVLADTNSANYQVVTLTNSVFTTNTVVAVPIVANQRQWGEIWFKQNTNVVVYINGSAVATNSTVTQIPHGISLNPGAIIKTLSSGGSATQNMDLSIDYFEFYADWPNPR